jgi:hypothetical protein
LRFIARFSAEKGGNKACKNSGLAQISPKILPQPSFTMTPGFIKKFAGTFLTTEFYERFSAQAGLHHQFKPLLLTPAVKGLEDLWDFCINKIGREKNVLFLEFGVWQGNSIRYFSKHLPNPDSRFIGCDSFEGLPERWATLTEKTFSTGGKPPQIDDARVTFVKGWFQNTFDQTIKLARQQNPHADKVLIHFDADLYSSTLFLLSRLHNEFEDYFFVFDEFIGHESRALLNFQEAYGADVEFYCRCGGDFQRVFGKLNNMKGKYQPGAGQIS